MKTTEAIATSSEHIERLESIARELRTYSIAAIYAASSGHPGGTLSIMDIVAVLYFHTINHQPGNFCWPERDRVIWSAGHKAPALYAVLARSGYLTIEELMCLRQLDGPCQGHPNMRDCCGVEMSAGSLGQGLGVAIGAALAARLDGSRHRIYCIMGDGEQQEGSVWEAAMSAGHFGLDNICAIVDRNRLQIDGWTKNVMDIEPLADKYRAFGWHAIEINGHDISEIIAALDEAESTKGRPTVIIADTVKGKGISFMENEACWHGMPMKKEHYDVAIKELIPSSITIDRLNQLLSHARTSAGEMTRRVRADLPSFSCDYWWNSEGRMYADTDSQRAGFGRAVEVCGDDPRVVTVHADISAPIGITDFEENNPERVNRVFSVGIAEQNMMSVAAGLAKEGKVPITGSFSVFASGRVWDQVRTSICYANLNVKIAGAAGGITVGADGATHQALEDISLMSVLPNMNLLVPADSLETERATISAIREIVGPVYIRYSREATPIITSLDTPFIFGKANVIRYRGPRPKFADAFETVLASEYANEDENIAIIACGLMVPEAMRAAYILKEEFGLETRVLNVHTVKPLDREAVARAGGEIGVVLTAEEHQVGGFGSIIAGAMFSQVSKPIAFGMVGVNDRFGGSGRPWELMQAFGLTAEHIAQKAHDLYSRTD